MPCSKLALSDEEPYVRAAAIRGLDEYEGNDLIPVLINLLLIDPDTEVRREAAIGLGRYALQAELEQLNHADAARHPQCSHRERRRR